MRFVTTVDIDAPTRAHISQDALERMLCFYVIGRLSGNALGDACQSLVDIYAWHMEQTNSVPQVPQVRHRPVAGVRRVERVPFAVDED